MRKTYTNFGIKITENRLCYDGPLEQAGEKIGNTITSFADGINARFENIFGIPEKNRRSLLDESQWVHAFNEHDIFEDATEYPLPQSGLIYPLDVLRSLSLEDRKREFVRFIRSMVPDEIILSQKKRKMFTDKAFRLPIDQLENYFDNNNATVKFKNENDPNNSELETLKALSRALVGDDIQEDEPGTEDYKTEAKDIAYEVLMNRYALPGKGKNRAPNLDVQYKDFVETVDGINPKPNPLVLKNPKLLVSKIIPSNNIMVARFKAALRLGIIKQADLDRHVLSYQARELERSAQKHIDREKVNRQSKEIKDQIRSSNRTLMDNWYSMSPGWKFFTVAATAFATYKMLKSKNKFLKSIPFVLGGALIYRRLVLGDEQPLNAMGKFTQDTLKFTGRPIKAALRALKILPPPEVDRLSIMQDFLSEKDMEEHKVAHAFAALSHVNLRVLGDSLSINSDGTVNLNIDDYKRDENGNIRKNTDGRALENNLPLEIRSVSQRKNLKSNEIMLQLKDSHAEVNMAMADVLLLIGSLKHPEVESRLEAKRLSVGVENISDLKDPDSLKDRMLLMNAGKGAMEGEYKEKSFVDLVGILRDKHEKESTFNENAEIISNPLELENRAKEKNLHKALRENVMTKETAKDKEIIHKSTEEYIDNIIALGIVHNEERDLLINAFKGVIDDESTNLSETLIAVERMKYALQVAYFYNNGTVLSRDNIEEIFGTKTLLAVDMLARVAEFLNNTFTVSSEFFNADSIADLKSILAERIGGPESADENGFEELIIRLTSIKRKFSKMQLDPTIRNSFTANNIEDADVLLEQLIGDSTNKRRVASMEKYFAHRAANAIALAMLSQHRVDGKHVLDTDLSLRRITPREEQNLLREFDALFEEIAGDVDHNGKHEAGEEGMWEPLYYGDAELIDNDELIKKDLPDVLNKPEALDDLYFSMSLYERAKAHIDHGAGDFTWTKDVSALASDVWDFTKLPDDMREKLENAGLAKEGFKEARVIYRDLAIQWLIRNERGLDVDRDEIANRIGVLGNKTKETLRLIDKINPETDEYKFFLFAIDVLKMIGFDDTDSIKELLEEKSKESLTPTTDVIKNDAAMSPMGDLIDLPKEDVEALEELFNNFSGSISGRTLTISAPTGWDVENDLFLYVYEGNGTKYGMNLDVSGTAVLPTQIIAPSGGEVNFVLSARLPNSGEWAMYIENGNVKPKTLIMP